MKARLCDFCGRLEEDPENGMLYALVIYPAEDFEAETAKEKALLLDLEDICIPCTRRAFNMLAVLKKGIQAETAAARKRGRR